MPVADSAGSRPRRESLRLRSGRRWRRVVNRAGCLFHRGSETVAVSADPALPPDWQAFEELEDWFNRTDRSLAAYMTRQWRFRHGRLVFAAIFLVAPALVLAGAISDSVPTILAGATLFVVTPVGASLIVKVDAIPTLRKAWSRTNKEGIAPRSSRDDHGVTDVNQ